MSQTIKKDAYFIGMWKDDVVTDNIIKEVVTRSTLDKGRRVKLKLTAEGLHISKSSMFKIPAKIDFIPIASIYFMTVNRHNPTSLLCIVRDPVHKYNVLAFRCITAVDAGKIVTAFKSIRGDDVRMLKRDDGNWTLRARSSKDNQRPMLDMDHKEPFNTVKVNGDVRYNDTPDTDVSKPDVEIQEVVTKGEEFVIKGKVVQNIGVQTHIHDEVDTMSEISDVSSFKQELDYLSQELREVKYLLEKSTGISAEEHLRNAKQINDSNESSQKLNESVNENNNSYVYTDRNGMAHAIVPDYRSFGIQTARQSGKNSYKNTPASALASSARHNGTYSAISSHMRADDNTSNRQGFKTIVNGRVVSVPVSQPLRVQTGSMSANREAVSGRDSLIMRNEYAPSTMSNRKSSSLRMRSSSSSGVPTSIERPIEYTYSSRVREPFVVGQPISRKVRPKSLYIISGSKPLTVHNPIKNT